MNLLQRAGSLMVAPMMGWTTRHYRYFLHIIAKPVVLHTEMITTGAILRNSDRARFLAYHEQEQPLTIQLGGAVPSELAEASKIAEDCGYMGINLNVGCPSARAQSGCFGAVLFKNAPLVSECIAKMHETVRVPLSVKTRIGVDHDESYGHLASFVRSVSQAGCQTFMIHARKAWLSGLSPKENREIPPLNYAMVYRIKREFPHLNIIINGGIQSLAAASAHLAHVDGVMIGRAAWHNPYLFRALERDEVHDPAADQRAILEAYIPYMARFAQSDTRLCLIQPLFGLFHGLSGARRWRRDLSELIQATEQPLDSALHALLKKISGYAA